MLIRQRNLPVALEGDLHTTETLTAPVTPVIDFETNKFSNLPAMMLMRQRHLAVTPTVIILNSHKLFTHTILTYCSFLLWSPCIYRKQYFR